MSALSAAEKLDAELARLIEAGRLNHWTDFVQALNVPDDLLPSVMTGRSQLVRLCRPRAITAPEHEVLLKLIEGLLATNAALRSHAEQTAHLCEQWEEAFKAPLTLARRVASFGRFKRGVQDEDGA